MRRQVDLPAPLAPKKPVISPSRAMKETSRAASMLPKRLLEPHSLDHGEGPVMLMKNGCGECCSRQPASSLSGAALSRNSAINRGTQPVRQLTVTLAFQYQVPVAGQPSGGALGIGRRRHRVCFAGQQQSRDVAVQRVMQIGIHRPARPELANLVQGIDLRRALVGFRHGGAIDIRPPKKGSSSLQITLYCMPFAS